MTQLGRWGSIAVVIATTFVVLPAPPASAATGYVQNWSLATPTVVRSDQPVLLQHFNTQSCSPEDGGAIPCPIPDLDISFQLDGVELGSTHYSRGSNFDFGVATVAVSGLPPGPQIVDRVLTASGNPDMTGTLHLGVTVVDPQTGGDRIDNLYRFLLGRPVDPSGAAFFAGRSDGSIAAVLLASDERRGWLVGYLLFPRLLARLGDPGGVQFFAGVLAQGVDERAVAASIMQSPEYAARVDQSGSTIPCAFGFVTPMYIDLLHRAPEACATAQYWSDAGLGAAGAMAMSGEAAERIVEDAYSLYLDRTPVASEVAHWAGVLAMYTPDTLLQGILGSAEYAALWG